MRGSSLGIGQAFGRELHGAHDLHVRAAAAEVAGEFVEDALRARALLAREPQPSAQRIRDELSGNLCRCGTHVEIVRAVELAAERLADPER